MSLTWESIEIPLLIGGMEGMLLLLGWEDRPPMPKFFLADAVAASTTDCCPCPCELPPPMELLVGL